MIGDRMKQEKRRKETGESELTTSNAISKTNIWRLKEKEGGKEGRKKE